RPLSQGDAVLLLEEAADLFEEGAGVQLGVDQETNPLAFQARETGSPRCRRLGGAGYGPRGVQDRVRHYYSDLSFGPATSAGQCWWTMTPRMFLPSIRSW